MSHFAAVAGWVAVSLVVMLRPASAQLVFYYDPDTGNVAFDTAGFGEGRISSYRLRLFPGEADFRFRPENHTAVMSTTFKEVDELAIGELSFSTRVGGYLTLGDILPPNLSEAQWLSLNHDEAHARETWYQQENGPVAGAWLYSDFGSSTGALTGEVAEFVYGQLDRPFDNTGDLLDPDKLDWATAATLVYDPATGELTVDTSRGEGAGYISWFILESDGKFSPENFTPWIESPFTTATSEVIGFAADAMEPGVYSAGRILAPGMTLNEVRAEFTNAQFYGRAGFGSGDFDFDTDGTRFSFALAVPEPMGAVLALTLVAGLAAQKRAA